VETFANLATSAIRTALMMGILDTPGFDSRRPDQSRAFDSTTNVVD